MKKLLLMFFLTLMCGVTVYGQDSAEMSDAQLRQAAKARREVMKQTRKAIESKCLKDAKKQAKALKKDGWRPAIGTAPMERQLSDYLMRQYEQSGAYPRYITAQGSAISGAYSTARKAAEMRARTGIAATMHAELSELAEDAHSNGELTTADVETITKFMSTGKQLVNQSMGRTEVMLDIYRERDGVVEAWVGVSYDGTRAKADIMREFEGESAELRAKLEQMLGE